MGRLQRWTLGATRDRSGALLEPWLLLYEVPNAFGVLQIKLEPVSLAVQPSAAFIGCTEAQGCTDFISMLQVHKVWVCLVDSGLCRSSNQVLTRWLRHGLQALILLAPAQSPFMTTYLSSHRGCGCPGRPVPVLLCTLKDCWLCEAFRQTL